MGGGAGADYDDFGVHGAGFLGGAAQRRGEGREGPRWWIGSGLERAGGCEGEGEAGAEGERGEAVEGFGKQDEDGRGRLVIVRRGGN